MPKKWKLTPIPEHLDHPNWAASTSKIPEIVEAENEDEARRVTSNKYFLATAVVVGQRKRTSPWLGPALVYCVELDE